MDLQRAANRDGAIERDPQQTPKPGEQNSKMRLRSGGAGPTPGPGRVGPTRNAALKGIATPTRSQADHIA